MVYDTDTSFSPSDDDDLFDDDNDLFDDDDDVDDASQATDVDTDDRETNKLDVDEDVDADDRLQLYDGNVYPPEYYRQRIENPAPRHRYARYSEKFRPLLEEVEGRWNRYCAKVMQEDPVKVFESITIPILEQFLEWSLNQKIGKNGRKMKGIKKASSTRQLWKNLQIVHKVAMGKTFGQAVYDKMTEVVRDLAKSRGHTTTTRVNRPMTTETLKQHIQTTLSTTKKSFDLGELRIYAVLFLLLLSPQGSRPQSILQLRYRDIRVVLARDPEQGPHNVLLKFTPEFTKRYLAPKEATTSIVPENLFDRSLLLSPHVFLLALLFRHQAFQECSSPEHLSQLDIFEHEYELPLPLRDDLDDIYIFRKAVRTLTGYELAKNEPITYDIMASWIRGIGKILGVEYNVIAYSLRYATGNNLDQSPNISEALRNLCLGHADSGPFQRHYLSRQICADTFAINLGEKQQTALIKQSCSIAHSMSKRRPTKLTPAQVASVNTDPRIIALERKRRTRSTPAEKLEASKELRNAKARIKNALLDRTRAEWTAKQAVDDIQRQLRGEGFAPLPVDTSGPQHPAQKRLVAALTVPPQPTLEAQYRRRNSAIHAVINYCSVEEGRTRCRAALGKSGASLQDPDTAVSAAALSVFVNNRTERPRRCFVCVGKALSLGPADPGVKDLLHEFYASAGLSRHFRRKHLSVLTADSKPECLVCVLSLSHKNHLQKHALEVHGTVS